MNMSIGIINYQCFLLYFASQLSISLEIATLPNLQIHPQQYLLGSSETTNCTCSSHKSQQLAALIELAKEQAIFNAEELGILFTKDSYAFYKLTSVIDKDRKEKSVWKPIEGDRILSKRTLPDGLLYELFLEGVEVNFSAANLKEITPHVFILSDGSISPFELQLTDDIDHVFKMTMAGNGKYEINAVN